MHDTLLVWLAAVVGPFNALADERIEGADHQDGKVSRMPIQFFLPRYPDVCLDTT
ncbi:hypothetical protein [Mesorhizobium sp. M0244]|uniref:hypothetical protein n=1 Tax=unclassified Mesorhizobium TaxID=325217 RepID=UPI00333B108C